MHPTGRFKAKVISVSPTESKDGLPQLQIVFKTDYGTITNWMRFGGARGDMHIEIAFQQLALLGLPNEDLSKYEILNGRETLIDVDENEGRDGKVYTNIRVVDPNYVPKPREVDPLEWKKLAARMATKKKDEDPFA